MSGMPAFPPPANPDNLGRGPMVMGITWTFSGLAFLTTLLRMYVRKSVGPHLASEDWLMLVAMLLQMVNQIFITIAFTYGMGKHTVDLDMPHELINLQRWEWYALPPGLAAGILGRISICILLVRLFGINVWFKRFAIILTAIGVTVGAVIPVLVFVQIHPVEGLRNPFTPGITTWDPSIVQTTMFTGQALYALADLAFVIWPVVIIWRLNMNLSLRLGLCVLMAMSLFLCAMSIMKGVSAVSNTGGPDGAYAATLPLLWATLEQSCVVLLGNVAPLRPLVKLEIPIITAFTNSLISLLGRGSRATTTGSRGKPASDGEGPYHDIELTTYRLGETGDVSHEIVGGNSLDQHSFQGKGHQGQVRRTNAFTVVYADDDSSSKKA